MGLTERESSFPGGERFSSRRNPMVPFTAADFVGIFFSVPAISAREAR